MSAATVEFSESNGAGETVTNGISNINFGWTDAPNLVPASYPMVIPSIASPRYSYDKYIRFHVSSMGTSSGINNLKFWKSSGAYKTAEFVRSNIGDFLGYCQMTYHTPQNLIRQTAVADVVRESSPGTANVSIDPVGTPDNGVADTPAGTLSAPGYSQYICVQAEFSNTTPTGSVNQKIFTLQYDEF